MDSTRALEDLALTAQAIKRLMTGDGWAYLTPEAQQTLSEALSAVEGWRAHTPAPAEWLLVELDVSDESHAVEPSAKIPLCGQKGVMMPLGGDSMPTCRTCARMVQQDA
jgi:hypothetical protein